MKKTVKLPLFLGSVALICAAALAIVNEVTEPVIEANEEKKANEGYLAMFELESYDGYTLITPEVTTELSAVGINKVLELHEEDSIFGVAYDASVNGYGGEIKFQVAFKEGEYAGFNIVASNETPSFGGDYFDVLIDYLPGLAADKPISEIAAETIELKSGTTMSREPVLAAIEAAADDYARRNV